jgi:hypothetical protein
MCRPNYETITNGIPVRVIDLEEKSVIHDEVIFEHGIARDERPNREETLFYYVSQSLGQGVMWSVVPRARSCLRSQIPSSQRWSRMPCHPRSEQLEFCVQGMV